MKMVKELEHGNTITKMVLKVKFLTLNKESEQVYGRFMIKMVN